MIETPFEHMLTDRVGRGKPSGDDLPYWLGLSQKPALFPAQLIQEAVARLSSIQALWSASEAQLINIGFDKKSINEIARMMAGSSAKELEAQADELRNQKIRLITILDKDYPARLRLIHTLTGPPIVLVHKGSATDFSNCVAIVGTRNASFRGRTVARNLARKLSSSGFTIVSGLARGIDVEAHMGALESRNGKTIAVLPWFEPIYPEEHSELVKEIESRGARISEIYQKPLSALTPVKFVERNRITSGLSRFVVIVETGEDGGTIRQAELARRQNKAIFMLNSKENGRAKSGHSAVIEKYNGVPFDDVDDLLEKVDARYERTPHLSEFGDDEQRKLM
jgi:DNA processing protein